MNILITGATGFIASQITSDLISAGHEVTCCVRDVSLAQRIFPKAKVMACDFEKDVKQDVWLDRVKECDVVINCAGILYHPKKEIIWNIHYHTPKALFDACVKMGIKKIIQISALGIDKCAVDYATSKKAADDYLLTLPTKAIVLRPSLVYARGSYGGTSLFRGLAGLPGIMPLPGKGKEEFQPIHIKDLSQAINQLILKPIDKSIILDSVGPGKHSLKEILITLRSWLGFKKAKIFSIPLWLIKPVSWFGNLIPFSTINTTSYKMLMQTNVSTEEESKRFFDYIGFMPRDFANGIYSEPSSVQDHWHARLYFLKPALRITIAFIWLFTAVCSVFFFPKDAAYSLLEAAGVGSFWKPILLYGASALDAFLGIAMLANFKIKKICLMQIIVITIYTLVLTWKLPLLWLDPFAPLAKNIPLLVTILIFMAVESDK